MRKILIFFLFVPLTASADEDEKPLIDSLLKSDVFSISGFVDSYYSDDFNNFQGRERSYLTQPQVNDELNVNLVDLSLKLNTDKFRSTIAGQYGTSVDANYSAEREKDIRYLEEGYFGVKPVDKLWIDVGVFLSHVGMESWRSRDSIAYTRALVSEFSPYYESGVRATYQFSDTVTGQLLAVNGWQNISHYDGRWALGTLLTYAKPEGDTYGWSTFVGNESDQARIFNDLYYKVPVSDRWKVGVSGDIGWQDTEQGRENVWFGWIANAEYKLDPKIGVVGRVEQYVDRGNIIVATPDNKDFATFAYSLGLNVELQKYLLWRSEIRLFNAADKIFAKGEDGLSAADAFFVTSLSYTF